MVKKIQYVSRLSVETHHREERASLSSWNWGEIASGKGERGSLHLVTRKTSWRKFREEEPTVALCLEELADEKKHKELTM